MTKIHIRSILYNNKSNSNNEIEIRKLKFSIFAKWIPLPGSFDLTFLIHKVIYLLSYENTITLVCSRAAVYVYCGIFPYRYWRPITKSYIRLQYSHTYFMVLTSQRVCLSISIETFNTQKHNIGIQLAKNLERCLHNGLIQVNMFTIAV